jgi:hypothetical protein
MWRVSSFKVKFYTLAIDTRQPVLDVLSGKTQIFHGKLPDIKLFHSSSKLNSQFFLVPHDSKHWTPDYLLYVKKASEEKPLVYFNRSDNPTRYRIENSFSLQHTVPPGKLAPNTIVIPYNVKSLEHLSFRSYGKPVISFVGFSPRVSPRRILNGIAQSPMSPIKSNGALIRKFGIKRLATMPNAVIKTNSFYGGAESNIPSPEAHRNTFLNSIENSDFVFSPRGDANGSQRFFEVLSCGRIPVVPQSKIILPKVIEGGTKATFLEIRTLSSDLAWSIDAFWSRLDNDAYFDIQVQNRKSFNSSLNFCSYLISLFGAESIESWKSFLQTPEFYGGVL